GPRIKQGLASPAGQLNYVFAAAITIGGVGLIGQIDKIRRRQSVGQGAVNGQPAYAGIKNAYGHEKLSAGAYLQFRTGRSGASGTVSLHTPYYVGCKRLNMARTPKQTFDMTRRTTMGLMAATALTPALAPAQEAAASS